MLTEAEAAFWNGGVCEASGSTEYESGEKIVGLALFREYNLQRLQSMHEDSTEEEKQQRMRIHDEENQFKTKNGR